MRRAQLYRKNPKSAKRSPMPKNSGKTQLTKNKVEQIMPIEDLLEVVDDKPTFKNRFACKFEVKNNLNYKEFKSIKHCELSLENFTYDPVTQQY